MYVIQQLESVFCIKKKLGLEENFLYFSFFNTLREFFDDFLLNFVNNETLMYFWYVNKKYLLRSSELKKIRLVKVWSVIKNLRKYNTIKN